MTHALDIVCEPTAVPASERDRHAAEAERLFLSADHLVHEPNGYRFRLPGDPETIRAAADFISRERLCCPFLDFTLEVPRGREPVWLVLSGRPGVKDYLAQNLIDRWKEAETTRPEGG